MTAKTVDQLFSRVDKALYAAKMMGVIGSSRMPFENVELLQAAEARPDQPMLFLPAGRAG